jgi:hypothetical protein
MHHSMQSGSMARRFHFAHVCGIPAELVNWTPFSMVRQEAFSLLNPERFVQVSEYMRRRRRRRR